MKYKKTILDNGLRIITVPLEHSSTVTATIFVESGPLYETKEDNGISHFVEHMCTKGSRKWPTAKDFDNAVDNIAARTSEFTFPDRVFYLMKAHSRYAYNIVEMLDDLYLHPTFDEKQIEKEKGVILSEIKKEKDELYRVLLGELKKMLYEDQPAGWTNVGEEVYIKGITKDEIISFHKEFYTASGATFVIAGGGFETETVVEQIRQDFKELSYKDKIQKIKTKEDQSLPQISFLDKDLNQAQLLLSIRSYHRKHKDIHVLNILNSLLRKGRSSRLWTRIRQKMGACYEIGSYCSTYSDFGHLDISTSVPQEKVLDVVKAILEELKRFSEEKVSLEELNKIKNLIISREYMSLEDVSSVCSWYGMQEFYGEDIISHEQWEDKINSVTADDIKRVATDLFKDEKLNLALLGSFSEGEKKELSEALSFKKQ